jgi:hypothetical protein
MRCPRLAHSVLALSAGYQVLYFLRPGISYGSRQRNTAPDMPDCPSDMTPPAYASWMQEPHKPCAFNIAREKVAYSNKHGRLVILNTAGALYLQKSGSLIIHGVGSSGEIEYRDIRKRDPQHSKSTQLSQQWSLLLSSQPALRVDPAVVPSVDTVHKSLTITTGYNKQMFIFKLTEQVYKSTGMTRRVQAGGSMNNRCPFTSVQIKARSTSWGIADSPLRRGGHPTSQ